MLALLRVIYYLSGIVLAAGIAIFIYYALGYNKSPDLMPFSQQTKTLPETMVTAVALDLNRDNKLNHLELKSGADAVIVIKAPVTEGTVNTNKFFVFQGAKGMLEQNKDFSGWLNQTDATFSELELVYFTPGESSFRISTLNEAGVQALYFNPEYLNAIRQGRENTYSGDIGFAVMSDSSRLSLQIIAVPQSYFANGS